MPINDSPRPADTASPSGYENLGDAIAFAARRVPRRRLEPDVTIVVPAKNEAANLREVLPELPPVHEVLVVDGHSDDDTPAVAREALPGVRVIQQTRRGKGNALACGFLAASGDVIVMFDADGSADPAEIPRFVDALVGGADFAKGSRFAPGGGSHDITALRAAGNSGLNRLSNTLFSGAFTDLCYGYNAFWRDLVPMLSLPPVFAPPDERMLWGDGFEIETVINCRVAALGLWITEVPSVERKRIHGETNLRTFSDGGRVLRTLVAEWQRVGRQRRTRRFGRFTPAPLLDAAPDSVGEPA
ncbi:glycosyltransferase family 2 protein [Amycolatopsis cynarae]|uniref:Glycosyltransferase family 2 protein n=1 Tax=Amycolatopsis cynarae TaxID=2995223 RepID=A0ABY7AWG9_9PSEU|nr:glycosyltransferase family 2 protein [Amycolatopsis sp. HUAS 11-8]WAL63519.1 glycosyltransferase family 2 protein [Amycolatopsis sp. HUAS 11-8]